jgi:hypothetical protein
MLNRDQSFCAYFSVSRLAAVELLLAFGSIIPLLPGAEVGATYTRLFFHGALSVIRWTACISLGALFLFMMPTLIMALLGKPAMIIDSDEIVVKGPLFSRLSRSSIASIRAHNAQGNVYISYNGGRKSVGIPLSLYRRRNVVLDKLKEISPT